MTERELTGYAVLVLLLAAMAWGWWRWRREVLRDRLMRWGTTKPPHRAKRENRS